MTTKPKPDPEAPAVEVPAPDPEPVEPEVLPTHFRYIGALDSVVVVLPSGRTPSVDRGEVLEVLQIEAAALAAIPNDWEPATPDPDLSKEN